MTVVIDALKMCETHRAIQRDRVKKIEEELGYKPKFVIMNASDDPANARYIKGKVRDGEDAGLDVEVVKFDKACVYGDVRMGLESCQAHNIPVILQSPTFNHIPCKALTALIPPHLDADGFNIENLGEMFEGEPSAIMPATPKGVMHLLDYHNVNIEGKVALVVGRSTHVGKSMASILINEGATVISANSKTKDLDSLVRQADIVISCVGKPGLIKAKDIKKGAIVIGVGFSYNEEGKQILDFDVDEVVADGKALMVSKRINCTGKATINALIDNVIQLYEDMLFDNN